MYDVTYDGISGQSLGFHAKQRPDIPIPQEDIETVKVPGRDGVLTKRDGSVEPVNISITFSFSANTKNAFNAKVRDLKAWLCGKAYKELVLGDDTGYFYKVIYVKFKGDARREFGGRIGKATAVFTCDGYMYLSSGKEEYAPSDVLRNNYSTCHPIYKITHPTGGNECTLTVNGNAFTINPMGLGITIDTELMSSYRGTTDRSRYVSGDYEGLWLKPGLNTMSYSNGYTVKVIPRWRCL